MKAKIEKRMSMWVQIFKQCNPTIPKEENSWKNFFKNELTTSIFHASQNCQTGKTYVGSLYVSVYGAGRLTSEEESFLNSIPGYTSVVSAIAGFKYPQGVIKTASNAYVVSLNKIVDKYSLHEAYIVGDLEMEMVFFHRTLNYWKAASINFVKELPSEVKLQLSS